MRDIKSLGKMIYCQAEEKRKRRPELTYTENLLCARYHVRYLHFITLPYVFFTIMQCKYYCLYFTEETHT